MFFLYLSVFYFTKKSWTKPFAKDNDIIANK